MTRKLSSLSPSLASTQVSRWLTRDISELSVKSQPSKFIDNYITLIYEPNRLASSSGLVYTGDIVPPASGKTIITMGYTNQLGSSASPFWFEYDPDTNNKTLYAYTKAGNHYVTSPMVGRPDSTNLDMVWLDSSNNYSHDVLRVTKSNGNIAYQVASGSVTGTYSSGQPMEIVYEGGGGPTILFYNYRTGLGYVGVVVRFSSTLTVSQSAYFNVNITSQAGTNPYSMCYCPGATNALIWGGFHDIGNRIIGAISGGMGGAAVADMSEYGNSYVFKMDSSGSTIFFTTGQNNLAAGITGGYISKHDASALTTAPTTRSFYMTSGSVITYDCVYDATNDAVYAVGYAPSSTTVSGTNSVGFVIKYVASTMTLAWQREFVIPGRETYFWRVELDPDNNLIIGGEVASIPLIIKYNASGPLMPQMPITFTNNIYEETTIEVRAGSATTASPTTTISSRSYQNFAAPSVSFGTSTNWSKSGTTPTYTTEKFGL